jgi:hypothetical protein
VHFRPTPVQALGRGGYLGGVLGVAASPVLLLAWGLSAARAGIPCWLAVAAPLVAGPVLGATFGLAFGRITGTDVDNLGIHPVPGRPGLYAPWQRIEDLRTERVDGRTQVAVCFDTGYVARLGAPYDGRLLAGDPKFERKLFMLRNLWETHRSFTLHYGRQSADGG